MLESLRFQRLGVWHGYCFIGIEINHIPSILLREKEFGGDKYGN
jgi:hypothetical protein